MDTIDQLETRRHRRLLAFLAAYVAWQVPTIIQDAWSSELTPGTNLTLSWLAGLAGLVWLIIAIRLARLMRRAGRSPADAAALVDERVVVLRTEAYRFGFWMLLGFLIAVRLAAFGIEIPARIVAQTGIGLAITSAVAAFLYKDRESA